VSNKDKDHVAGLAIQVPDQMLRQVIMAEVAKALPDRERLIEAIVRECMTQKKNSYDSDTIFGTEIKSEIRSVCHEVFREWLVEQRDAIREALVRELNKGKAKRLKSMVDSLAAGLSDVCVGSVQLKIGDPDDF
jgi:hypothetical protein